MNNKNWKWVAALLMLIATGSVTAQTVPGEIAYQGRVFEASGTPVEGASVPMEFSLWDKAVTQETVVDETTTLNGTTPASLSEQDLVPDSETVTPVGGGPPFYTKDSDYTMDYVSGTITRVDGGFILDGQQVEVDFDWISAGSTVWSESRNVTVVGGLYNIQLGAINPLPPSVFSTPTLHLEVTVQGETMTPRSPLTAVPYSMNAAMLDGFTAGDFSFEGHGHDFIELSGAATDAQVPNDITIDMALDSMSLGGLAPSEYVSASGDTITGDLQVAGDLIGPRFVDSDAPQYYVDPSNTTWSMDVRGDIRIGSGDTTDNDAIYFDNGNQQVMWVDPSNLFWVSNTLVVNGQLYSSALNDSDDATYFLDPSDQVQSMNVAGNISVGSGDLTDDDYIYFDGGSEFMLWDESLPGFFISNTAVVNGQLYASVLNDSNDATYFLDPSDSGQSMVVNGDVSVGFGDQIDDDYIYFDGGSEHLMWDEDPGIFIFSDFLQATSMLATRFTDSDDTSFYIDPSMPSSSAKLYGGIWVGNGSATDNDYIWFDTGVEWFRWDEATARFMLSDDLFLGGGNITATVFYDGNDSQYFLDPSSSNSGDLAGNLSIGNSSAADDDYLYFDAKTEYLWWDESQTQFNFSDDLSVSGDLLMPSNAYQLRFTHTDPGYIITVDNTTNYGIWYNTIQNSWDWVGAGSVKAQIDLDNGDFYTIGSAEMLGDLLVHGGDIYDNSSNMSISSEDSLFINIDHNNDDADINEIVFGKDSMTAPTELMRITESGRLGINETLPNSFIHVDADGVIPGLRVQNNGLTKFLVHQNDGVCVGYNCTPPANGLYVSGDANIIGTLSKGAGSFKIDHPLDPENKYLYHSFVESPDMKNIYDGVVELDSAGEAVVTLPDWFEALNRDFRYQLTPIGAPGPNLYIAEEISGNRFGIAGGEPGMKVSWQVTGIRQDAFANENRIPVEVEKAGGEKGKYMHPSAFGLSKAKGLNRIEE